ncbi:MAG: hypothetical protein P8125_11980 [Gemmatimonadota bacterium]
MRWRIPLVLALVALVSVSCEQQPVEPQNEQVSEATFDFLNNPDNGNPRITRYEDYWRFCWSDADSEYRYRVCHVSFPYPEPQGCDISDLGPPLSHFDLGDWDVDNPRIHHIIKGETWVTIRDTWQEGDCFGNVEVASGWGKFMHLDNDVFGTAEGDRNANTWQYKGTGQLMTPGGDEVAYNGRLHLLFSNARGFTVLKESVKFR